MPDLSSNVLTVVDFSPDPNSDDYVPAIPNIVIKFSGDMLLGSLNSNNAIARGMRLFADGSANSIPLNFISYTIPTRELTVQPAVPLTPDVKYSVLVESKNDGFLNTGGRSLRSSRSFFFYVTDWQLPEPVSQNPSNGAVCDVFPLLSVYVPPFVAPSGYAPLLNFQISVTPVFDDEYLFNGSMPATGNALHNFLPKVSFVTDKTYYWRAQLGTSKTTGYWTEVQDFYYGSRFVANQDSRRTRDDNTLPFIFQRAGFVDGQANLTTWPDISLNFSHPLPSTFVSGSYSFDSSKFSIKMENVDGSIPSAVLGSWIMQNPYKVSFIPSGQLAFLTRYTVTVAPGLISDNGEVIPDRIEIYFTGPYKPLYAFPVQLRAEFGSLVDDVSDDLLCFHLYRASIDANYKARIQPMVNVDPFYFFSGPSTQQLRGDNYDFLYAVHMWVITYAAIRVLNMRLYETVPASEGKLQIGDYSQSLSSVGVLQFLQAKIKDMERKLHEYEMRFSRQATRPRTGERSSAYNPNWLRLWDNGYRNRRKF